jgi:hypothetical protein
MTRLTTYSIEKTSSGYLLKCESGPFKHGHETIPVENEEELIQALIILHVPEDSRARVLQDLGTDDTAHVTFDARALDPL